jgi:S-adenosylmethionine/arginine decarboxylase-like enzyme
MELVHQQTLIRVHTNFFFQSEAEINNFLYDLVKELDMDVIIPPRAAFCDQPGNTGLTAQIGLVTSHATIHSWDEFNFHEMDIYSCKTYDVKKVLNFIQSRLKAQRIEYKDFDRVSIEMNSVVYN